MLYQQVPVPLLYQWWCSKGVYKNDKHRRDVLIYLRAATKAVYFIIFFFSRYTGRPSPRVVARSHAQHVIIRDRCRLEAYRYYIMVCACVYVRVYVCVCVCVCVNAL